MKRRDILLGLAMGLALALPSSAQGVVDGIVRQLKKQGFKAIIIEETLLGRVQIKAISAKGRREIVVNPNSGEILRDLWIPAPGSTQETAIISGKDDDGDDDDDEEEDDSDDDDGKDGDDHGEDSEDSENSGEDGHEEDDHEDGL